MFWAWKFRVMFCETNTFFKCQKKHSSTSVSWSGSGNTILKLLEHVQDRTKLLINDSRVSNTIDLLKRYRNVACASLFYRYFNGFYFRKINWLALYNGLYVFLAKKIHIWLIGQWIVHCTTDKIIPLAGQSVYGAHNLLRYFLPITYILNSNIVYVMSWSHPLSVTLIK